MKTKEKSHEVPVGTLEKKYKILLTGDEGFIGRKVKAKMREMGHDVYGYDIVDGKDLLDLNRLEEQIRKVDIVYHIAAEADLTKMMGSPDAGRKGVMANVEATHNVAYLCAKHKKWMVYASTVCVYGNVEQHPEKEDETLPNPSELYACSKYAAEWIMRGYGKNYNMPWTSLRFATIYGEGMRPALGMHIFFRQAMKGEDITVHGTGEQDRTLTLVDDLVEGIVAPLNHPEGAKNQVFNLSSKKAVSAKKMAEDIKKLTGSKSEIKFIEQRDNQTYHEDFDVSKAKKLLKWEAKTSWEDGLKLTYEWMKTQV